MGFTAVDGLMMGTRCGALDPGVLIHLVDLYGLGARELEDLIYRKSGLLGVSGIASDMRALRASSEPAAKEAIELFVYRIVREIVPWRRRWAGSTRSFSRVVLARTMPQREPKSAPAAPGSA
jgi:acetate kinase